MSTHVKRNHVVHAAGNSADIEQYRKTRLDTSCHQNSGTNLDTFAKEQSLVSSQCFVSQNLNEVLIRADHVLGLEREADFSRYFENYGCHTP